MGNRQAVVGEQIRQVLSSALLFEMRDPDLEGIVITRVKVSPSLEHADVRFTYPVEVIDANKVIRAFGRAKGALRRYIAKNVKLRKIPDLRFHADDDVFAERRIGDVLEQLNIPQADDNDI